MTEWLNPKHELPLTHKHVFEGMEWDESEPVLITYRDHNELKYCIAIYVIEDEDTYWEDYDTLDEFNKDEVLAWMYLPKPYEEEEK